MSDKYAQKVYPARYYGRDPMLNVMEKEQSIHRRVRGCIGCRRLMIDASGERLIAVCQSGRKVGAKEICTQYLETE